MSFFPSPQQRSIPPLGKTTAKIAIVGDYTSNFDVHALKPFQGPGGQVLENVLHGAGLILGEVYMTNCIKSKSAVKPHPKKGPAVEYFDEGTCRFTELGLSHVDQLRTELNGLDANVIVTCGPAAFQAVCGLKGLSKYRGYVWGSRGLAEVRKVIPTHSPASTIRGMYIYRHMMVADFKKAKLESTFPEINRPERQLVYDYANVEEALQWLKYYEEQSLVSVDIEVVNYEVACISFSSSPDIGCVIPIGNTYLRPQGWSQDEEALIWRGIQRVCGNPNSIKILQNAIFDIQFLLSNSGVVFRGEVQDTMIGHSVMYTELPKGLGFLGSIYCGSQQYWKDTVKFNNIKDES